MQKTSDKTPHISYDKSPVNLIVSNTSVATDIHPEQKIQLKNTGNNSYTVAQTVDNPDFTVSGCETLAAGSKLKPSKCSLTVVYNPRTATNPMSSGSLSITVSDTKANFPLPPIQLTGQKNQTLHAKAPTASANDFTDITFNAPTLFVSTINDSSETQKIVIHNAGSKRYTIYKASISGTNATDFTLTNCEAVDLDYNNRDCIMQVVYSPKSAGMGYATVTADVVDPSQSSTTAIASVSVPIAGHAFGSCDKTPSFTTTQKYWFWLPLDHKGVDQVAINCFYNTPSNLAFVTQVQYQYSPASVANTFAADLVSLQFPLGFQLSLAGAGATSSCSNATSTNATATSTNCSGTAQGATPSLAQDVQTIEQGGNFALKIQLPLLHYLSNSVQLTSLIQPRFGFTVNGLSSQNTAATATDLNVNVSSESYAQLGALPLKRGGTTPGSIFVDYRVGWQQVPPSYVTTAGLQHQNFALQQLELGLVISNAFRISAERYFGPSQVYVDSTNTTVTVNNFNSWGVRIQLAP